MSDYIKRADFERQLEEIEEITMLSHIELGEEPEVGEISMPMRTIRAILNKCPSADVVSREEYEEAIAVKVEEVTEHLKKQMMFEYLDGFADGMRERKDNE